MTKEEAANIVRNEWDAQGQCQSCGWHSALYEIEPIEISNIDLESGKAWFPCRSIDGDSHRGVKIRLKDVP